MKGFKYFSAVNQCVALVRPRYFQDYLTRAEARQSIFVYIEIFYNRKRRHAFLNYMTPVEYERKHA